MTDYYKLYDFCIKTFEKKDYKRQQYLANKKARLKKELFVNITKNASNIIKENAEEGFDYAIIYDDEYNELIYDLLDSLAHHFKPFNVIYKKKLETQRGFFEVLNDETNYVIMVDWKAKKPDTELKNINVEKSPIIYSNISELPSKNTLSKEKKLENEILDDEKNIKEFNKKQQITEEKCVEEQQIAEDNIIKKLGFEAIF